MTKLVFSAREEVNHGFQYTTRPINQPPIMKISFAAKYSVTKKDEMYKKYKIYTSSQPSSGRSLKEQPVLIKSFHEVATVGKKSVTLTR